MSTTTTTVADDQPELQELWEEAGFPAGQGFWEYLKDEGKARGRKKKDMLKFVAEQESRQVIRRQKRPKYENTIYTAAPRNQYQVDLMIYNRFKFGPYQYIIGVIDVNSRYVQCLPITSRQQLDDGAMFLAFKQIMKKMGPPKHLDSDNEFASAPIRSWCKQNGVKLYLSFADEAIDNKNALIESFWKTLAKRLAVRRRQGLTNWPSDLGKVIAQYNRTKHSTTGAKPIDVWEGRDVNKQNIVRVDVKFSTGDLVRRLLKLPKFTKGDAEGYSDEVYRLTRRDAEKKNRWFLEDIDTGDELPRSYTENSLQKVPQVVRKPTGDRAKEAERAAAEAEGKKVERRLQREMKQLQGELAQQAPLRPRGRVRGKGWVAAE